jgi:hypothetical protein
MASALSAAQSARRETKEPPASLGQRLFLLLVKKVYGGHIAAMR